MPARQLWLAITMSASLAACAIEPDEPALEQAESFALVFYEKFDGFMNGLIGGQNGWSGDCSVVGGPDKYLACPGNGVQRDAQHATNTGLETWGHYYMQFDMSMVGVVDGTHGKLFVEGPMSGQDTVIQVISGACSIRAVFGYYGRTTTRELISFPCGSTAWYRVVCTWESWGNAIRCGAAQYPNDPPQGSFVDIPAIDDNGNPEDIPAFDKVRVLGGIGGRVGTTNFEKIYLERSW